MGVAHPQKGVYLGLISIFRSFSTFVHNSIFGILVPSLDPWVVRCISALLVNSLLRVLPVSIF